jgi:hypothetical protein
MVWLKGGKQMQKMYIWAGLTLGLSAAVVIGIARKRRLPLPWSAWLPGLVAAHGQEDGNRLLSEAYQAWEILLAEYPRPLPKPPLREHLVNNMMTGTALYRGLLKEHGGDRAAALAEIEPLFKAWTTALYGGTMKAFRMVPFPFWFFKLATKIQLRSFPAEVWGTSWVEDSPRRIAYNNLSCPYVTCLKAYGVPELTPFYCQIDDWMGEMLPPGIRFQRTQTLARGGALCDYSFEKVG